MKFGTHYLIGINSFSYDPFGTIDRAARLGFDALEIPFGDLMTGGGEERGLRIADYANKKGIKLAFCGGFPEECDMLSDDAAIRENGIRYMHNLLLLMQKMDADLLVGCHYTKWPVRRTETLSLAHKEELVERTAEAYRLAAQPAQECGVTCAIETLNRFEAYLLNCSEETADFVDRVGNPNVKVHFDTFHMNIEEDSIGGAIKTAGTRLAALHVAERNRRFPGMGDFCWDEFFSALKQVGFDGYMDLEVFMLPEGDMSAIIGVGRDISRGVRGKEFEQLEARSLEFLKDKAAQHGLI